MPLSFSTALSGLRASSTSLSATGNNIANANTTAYKSASTTFADVFTNSQGASASIGNGVQLASLVTNFSQGGLTDSGSATNAAIQGNGFFVVADPTGAQSYTRAGDFTLDRNGNLLTPTGHQVQGYAAVNGVVPAGAMISSMSIPLGEMVAPDTTTEASLRLNLNSADETGAVFHAPVRVFDSRGTGRTLDLVFTKQADGSYLLNATLDGNAAAAAVDGNAASNAPVVVSFDANGQLTAPASLSIVPDQAQLGGAALPAIAINLRQTNPDGSPGAFNLTNFATTSGVAATNQNGSPAGSLTGLSFSNDSDGMLFAVFNNGQRRVIGQVAVATFNAQTELRHLGGNLYGETAGSGQPSIGAGGSGGRGAVVGGALEQSNVDIATEFTDLIVAQRGFQANSRVITTINQTLQDLLQII